MTITNAASIKNTRSSRSPHPLVFLFLFLPYGIFSGYVTITLGYLFSKAGISVQEIAGLAAINLLPQVFKFLWAPMVDASLSLKKWYILAALTIAGCLLATGLVPLNVSHLQFLTAMILLSSFARSILSAAMGGLIAHEASENVKGRAAGYMMAGNLGGSAFGGGVGLWLSQHIPAVWVASAVLASICVLCCLALNYMKEPLSTIQVGTIRETANNLYKDVWQTMKTKLALLAMILCILPIGTNAAGNLFSAIAKDWQAGADTVALVTGIGGGIVTILGCLYGGWICDQIDRKKAYLLFGMVQAVALLGLAFCPHTRILYIIWTLIYTFITGLAYAAFGAYCLEATGKGAAASKFELYNSLGWVPVYLMIWLEGVAYTKWGANGMLLTEAVCACVSIGLFVMIWGFIARSKTIPACVEIAAGV